MRSTISQSVITNYRSKNQPETGGVFVSGTKKDEMKTKVKYPLAVLVVAFLFPMCGSEEGQTQETETVVSVMSSNIRYVESDTGEMAWEYRRAAYINMMNDVKPDVVGYQEVNVLDNGQTADLQAAFGDKYEFFRLYPGTGPKGETIPSNGTGQVMIMWLKAKYELLKTGYFWLGEYPDDPGKSRNPFGASDAHIRTALWVKLRDKASKKEFFVLNTHLPYDPTNNDAYLDPVTGQYYRNIEERKKCVEQIIKMVKTFAEREDTVFVVGDMNSSINSETLKVSLAPFFNYMSSAIDEADVSDGAISFNGWKDTSKSHIDYIFYRWAKALEYRTIKSRNYGVYYISDHYPIVCTFSLD